MEGDKKYVLVGGWVFSRADDQRHYIPAGRLRELYGLPPRDCIFTERGSMSVDEEDAAVASWENRGYVVLFPVYSGNYAGELARAIRRAAHHAD